MLVKACRRKILQAIITVGGTCKMTRAGMVQRGIEVQVSCYGECVGEVRKRLHPGYEEHRKGRPPWTVADVRHGMTGKFPKCFGKTTCLGDNLCYLVPSTACFRCSDRFQDERHASRSVFPRDPRMRQFRREL